MSEMMIKPRASQLAYLRFQAPDLDVMARFLYDFGLQAKLSQTLKGDPILYGRGTDGAPYCYSVEPGEPRFLGMGFYMTSQDDLLGLTRFGGASKVMDLSSPGGGHYVRFIDPQGYEVDGVYGWELEENIVPEQRAPINSAEKALRTNSIIRLKSGPSCVKKLGHCVVYVKDFRLSERWYKDRFGFLTSDEVYAGPEEKAIGAFMRCDQGAKPVDHHSIFLVGAPGKAPGLEHAAFEVNDWDDVMLGHDYLLRKGYKPKWGVGKHLMGSQVFDYWHDPYGHAVEHYTDGDLLTASVPANREPIESLLGVQWGAVHPSQS